MSQPTDTAAIVRDERQRIAAQSPKRPNYLVS